MGAPRQDGRKRQPPAMRKCHEGAGRNFLGELWEGILHMYNTGIMKVGSTLLYRRYVIEALTEMYSASELTLSLMPDSACRSQVEILLTLLSRSAVKIAVHPSLPSWL